MSVLFPLPVKDQPDDDLRDNGYVSVRGTCAWWCSEQEASVLAESGNTVVEHGDSPFCAHSVATGALGVGEDGQARYAGVELIAPYMHGVYERQAYNIAQRASLQDAQLRLVIDDGLGSAEEMVIYMGTGSARSLAAQLLKAADEREGLVRPMPRNGGR